jgi:hypothetical protein
MQTFPEQASGRHPDICASVNSPELLQQAFNSMRRRPWFKRILGFRALALPMPQDTIHHAGICNKRDDAHAAAARAQQQIRFGDFIIKRDHVLLASLEQSELSGTGCFAAGKPALSPSVGVTGIRARLD